MPPGPGCAQPAPRGGSRKVAKPHFLERFLRDICKAEGGGFRKAARDRGGVPKLRCLAARRDPEIRIEVELAESSDVAPTWRYSLAFKSEGKGQQRAVISAETVHELTTGRLLLDRPNDAMDQSDRERLTRTALEQIGENRPFRPIADFLGAVTYLHLVPQLLKYPASATVSVVVGGVGDSLSLMALAFPTSPGTRGNAFQCCGSGAQITPAQSAPCGRPGQRRVAGSRASRRVSGRATGQPATGWFSAG